MISDNILILLHSFVICEKKRLKFTCNLATDNCEPNKLKIPSLGNCTKVTFNKHT